LAPPWLHPTAAYVHVPFCAHHCGYCDFAVAAGQDQRMDLYLEALEVEMQGLATPQAVETVFIGGGTPTYLGPPQLERLLAMVRRWLPLAPGGEFSIESTPDSLDDSRVSVLAGHGITRVSIGAQSFQPHLLRVLERRHHPGDVAPAVERVRHRIGQFSLDLIFGVPGQTLAEWDDDLRRALALGPDHISTYGLTYEKGTRLWKQQQRKEVKALAEDAELSLYLRVMDTLEEAGYEHYEISNFARPGRRSRHNQVYWANHAYWGFGVGAARYVQGRRELNTRDLETYMRRVLSGEPATFQSEMLGPEERARETVVVQLRRADGINRASFREQTGYDLDDLVGEALGRHAALGLLEYDAEGVRLSRRGKCVVDAMVRDLL